MNNLFQAADDGGTGAGGGASAGEGKPKPRRRGSRGGRGRAKTAKAAPGAAAAPAPAKPRTRAAAGGRTRRKPAAPVPVVEPLTPPPAAPKLEIPSDDVPWQPVGPTLTEHPAEAPPAPREIIADAAPTPLPSAPAPSPESPPAEQPAAGQPGFVPGPPRIGMRPAIIRPAPGGGGGGRMSFSKGATRHQFRPSGFRPPRAFTPPGMGDAGDTADALPPQENLAPTSEPVSDDPRAERPLPPAQQPPQGQPGQNRPQHPHHRGPQGREHGQPGQGGHKGQPQQHRRGPNQGQGGGGGGGGRHGPQQQGRGPQPRHQPGHRGAPPAPRPMPAPIPSASLPPANQPPAYVSTAFSQVEEPQAPLTPVAETETFPLAGQPQSLADNMTQGAPLQPPSPADSAALAPFAEDIEIEEPVPQVRRQPTGREMLINVVEGEEVRIAVIRRTGNGMLEELYMERSSTESHIGNIYKGRVTNVEPSIQAAFIDFGIGKNGFLHISDLHPQYFPKRHQPRMPQPQRRMPPAPVVRRAPEAPAAPGVEGVPAGEGVAPMPPEPALPEGRPEIPPESSVMAHGTTVDAPAVQFESNPASPAAQPEIPADQQAENGPGESAPSARESAATEAALAAAPAVSSADSAAPDAAAPHDAAPAAEHSADAAADATEDPADTEEAPAAEGAQSDFGSAYRAEFAEDEEFMDEYESDELDDRHMKPMEKVGRKTPRRERPPIQQCLRRGQEVIVQVTKEGIGTKGPTLTSYISCPGRYLVMMPGMAQLGVSRKIEDLEQRRELKRTLQELNPPKNLGFIIRTAGTEVAKKELQGDLNYLVRMWKVIANRIRTHKAPVELYEESDLVIRTIRDVFNDQIDRIIVDNEQVASRVRDFLSIVDPRAAGFVELYTGTMPLFQKYGVEREIEKINSRRVEMANGGSLVIDSTEALVAIDVNSGRYREMRDAELTAFNMNKEAVKEVVRQLRLRDLGGVIVIDFIDMREERHKREIERILREEMENDRAKTKVLRMSQFCMIEMTRQRVRPSLKRSIYMDCPHCHGSALIKTPESVSLDAMRRLAAGATRMDVSRIDVRAYPSVATFLLNRKRKALLELEEKTGKRINITSDDTLAGDQIVLAPFDIRGTAMNLLL